MSNRQCGLNFVADLKFKTMKKLILAATIAATLGLSTSAKAVVKNDDDSKSISYVVMNQFDADFSGAKNVTWTLTPTSQKADFILNGEQKTAFYSLTGTFLGVTEQVDYKVIPDAAQKDIAADYQGYTVAQVIKFEASEDNTSSFYRAMAVDAPEQVAYFVDLKKDDGQELLVRVNQRGSVFFFKQVK